MAREEPIDPTKLAEIERANVQVVQGFLASWYEPHKTDTSFLAPDGAYRTHDTTRETHTAEGLIKYLKDAVGPDDRIMVTTHQIFAKGTLVVTDRTDIVRSPGKKDRIFEIVSDFTIKNAKIVEWTDHVYSWKVEP